MDEQEIKRRLAEQWPLLKALAEGKTVLGRLKDMKGSVWTRIVPSEHLQFNFDRVDYRIKEELSEAIDSLVREALNAAWAAQGMPELAKIVNNTRERIRKLFEEDK